MIAAKSRKMRIVGFLVILLGLTGALVFTQPELRWESAGAAIVGAVLVLSAKRAASP